MIVRVLFIVLLISLNPLIVFGQSLDLVGPVEDVPISEGDSIEVQLEAALGGQPAAGPLTFDVDMTSLPEGATARIDSTGHLHFGLDYSVVSRQSGQMRIPLTVSVRDTTGRMATANLYVLARHTNRPPRVGEVPPGYARPNETFVIDLKQAAVDPDGDRLRFSAAAMDLPENASLNQDGIFSWTLSSAMFRALPRTIPFAVTDGRETVGGSLQVRQTQKGIPPTVTLLGNQGAISVQEGGQVTLNISVDDPNGSDDIANVITTTQIPANNYQFTWPVNGDRSRAEFTFRPGYDFVAEGTKSRVGKVSFTAVDQDRREATPIEIEMTVMDLPDPNLLYTGYRTSLGSATSLLAQLTDRQDVLERRLSRVRTSERLRRVFATLLGMSTTAFSIFAEDDTRKYGTGISGMLTTGLTGLEAARIFTQSDVIDRQVQEVKTEILRVRFEAESMARDYATKESRTTGSFAQDRRTLEKLIMDTRTKLKITEDPPQVSDEEIKRYTIYFAPQ